MYDLKPLIGDIPKCSKSDMLKFKISQMNHIVLITGYDISTSNWQIENSWGNATIAKGYLNMQDEWFDDYGWGIVIHKKYLNKVEMQSRCVQLQPWDHLCVL